MQTNYPHAREELCALVIPRALRSLDRAIGGLLLIAETHLAALENDYSLEDWLRPSPEPSAEFRKAKAALALLFDARTKLARCMRMERRAMVRRANFFTRTTPHTHRCSQCGNEWKHD